MAKTVTAKEMKELDKYTIEKIGIPSIVLMERASLAIRDAILNHHYNLTNVIVVTGFGNNGGDGLVVARLLKIIGAKVTIINVGNPKHASIERVTQQKICDYYKIPILEDLSLLSDATLIIDAIFGIGIDRPVEGSYLDTILAINDSTATVVAVDVPSGLNADTGIPMSIAVRADLTVTVAFTKLGFSTQSGKKYVGELEIADDMGIYYF